MKQYVFSVLAILSSLLLIATITLRARSRSGSDHLFARTRWGATGLFTGTEGMLLWLAQPAHEGDYGDPYGAWWEYKSLVRVPTMAWDPPLKTRFDHMGLRARSVVYAGVYDREVLVQYWFAVAVTAVLPALSMVRALRYRRAKAQSNSCAKCGYDLRATPGRCPECGTARTLSLT